MQIPSILQGESLTPLLACAFLRPESEQNSSHPPAYTAAKVERWIDCPVPRQTPITSSPHSACSTDQAGIPTDHSFTDLQIPATVMTANLAGRCPAPISTDPEALMAALAIPALYPPWIRGEQRLVDAVSLTPVPLGSVVEAGADITIAVNLLGRETLPEWPYDCGNLAIPNLARIRRAIR
jgi:predicted acylesterase/phospholipase RssA